MEILIQEVQIILWVLAGVITLVSGLVIYIWKDRDKKDDEQRRAINDLLRSLPHIEATLEDIKVSMHRLSSDLEEHKKEYHHTKEIVSALIEFKKYVELRLKKLEGK